LTQEVEEPTKGLFNRYYWNGLYLEAVNFYLLQDRKILLKKEKIRYLVSGLKIN
jgi:hypothetical protein